LHFEQNQGDCSAGKLLDYGERALIQKSIWYFNRLRCMSVGEIQSRVKTAIRKKAESFGMGMATEAAPYVLNATGSAWINAPANLDPLLQAKADRIVQGKLNLFSLQDYELGITPNWRKDPKTGTVAPNTFGKSLDYRREELVGDIKYLWEPGRHLQLVPLAQAYAMTSSNVYLDAIQAHLDSWFDQCPYPRGPHWVSSLELGIRLLNWSIVWQLLGGAESAIFDGQHGRDFRHRWLNSIYQHVHFIRNYYSGYSSANNHLIGEASGVFVASRTWPYWQEFVGWGSEAKVILEREAQSQNFSDGVNKEQAISYQQFELDFLLLPLLCERIESRKFSDAYQKTIESMLEYLASVMDVGGNLPMIGDADDGYAVSLSAEPDFCPYRSLLATGAVLFNRADFKQKAAKFDQKSFALLGKNGFDVYRALAETGQALPVRRAFPEGGYYILGTDFETPSEVRMIVDVGPLGLGNIAAHGHADALSIYLSVGGSEILIDPGTYAYHTEKKWRDYFRGTAAHNTVRVDGLDQSEIGGNFMWLRKAQATLQTFSSDAEQTCLSGSHDGYLCLKDPVEVAREVTFSEKQRQFAVADLLSCKQSHRIEQFWHFSEMALVSPLEDNVVIVSHGGAKVRFTFDPRLSLTMESGDVEAPLGWVSRSFDSKVPGNSLRASIETDTSVTLNTRIEILAG
jgi:hypothetical protein